MPTSQSGACSSSALTIASRSSIAPGQSGFISVTQEPDPHYADQWALYQSFAYKDMVFTRTLPLWPPNHKLLTIEITGVKDPDEDPLTIRVDGITQDEPVNDRADGDTSPDGFGIGEALVQLRAERSGNGDGRVYHVSFTATDDREGSCAGTIVVGVPHDRKDGATPVDSGQSYDSTMAW